MATKSFIAEFIEGHPKLADRATRSPLAAIRMFCLVCVCGSRKEVDDCTAPDCALYPFRFGRRPAVEGVEKKTRPNAGAGLAAYRAKKKAEKVSTC